VPFKEGTGNKKVVTVDEKKIEFVVNNGEGDWDTPDPYGGGQKNYKITAPGTYVLRSGKVVAE
jgi:protein-tyrosine-phosphatase